MDTGRAPRRPTWPPISAMDDQLRLSGGVGRRASRPSRGEQHAEGGCVWRIGVVPFSSGVESFPAGRAGPCRRCRPHAVVGSLRYVNGHPPVCAVDETPAGGLLAVARPVVRRSSRLGGRAAVTSAPLTLWYRQPGRPVGRGAADRERPPRGDGLRRGRRRAAAAQRGHAVVGRPVRSGESGRPRRAAQGPSSCSPSGDYTGAVSLIDRIRSWRSHSGRCRISRSAICR